MPSTTKVTSALLIKELERLGYTFRLNLMNDDLEVCGCSITDPLRAKIRRDLRDLGYRRWLTAAEDAYLAYAYEHSYHPIQEYLEELRWDGLPHIQTLTSYFKDAHGGDVFPLFLKRWLVKSVAKTLDYKQNVMFVIDGAQDVGKSYFVRWLASAVPSQFFIEKAINPNDKDDEVRLISKWIWEVAELGATARRADREALKHFISVREVTVRKAYGRYEVKKSAVANLIGTINNEAGFLADPTGNRRFLVCTVKNIDWDYQHVITPDQVWAEAVAKYKSSEEDEFITPEEKQWQDKLNEEYMLDDPFENGMHQKCTVDPGNDLLWASSNDILLRLGYDPPRRADSMALASAAKKIGLRSGRKGYVRGYFGIMIP